MWPRRPRIFRSCRSRLVVLVGLFLIQRHGTGSVGKVFGPVMLGWFAILAVMGVSWIVREPRVLLALDPTRALRLITQHQIGALGVLAGVFLTVTGGEALYADMGHFGKAPIRLGWMCIVMPALVSITSAKGALLIENPAAISNPFYLMAPAVVAVALGRDRNRGHGDCIAGGDLRSVLRDHPGGELGIVAAPARRTFLGRKCRTDLCADDELDTHGGGAWRWSSDSAAPPHWREPMAWPSPAP